MLTSFYIIGFWKDVQFHLLGPRQCFGSLGHNMPVGVQWPSGRALDLRLKGCGLEPQQRHCVVSLSKTH